MKYSLEKKFLTGVAIPVSSLRTESSCGVGEFSDLKYFADWCKEAGLDLIQILPVNDTGYQSSPYSALSAFALHPIYISIPELPESKKFKQEIEKLKNKWEKKENINFNAILKDKVKLLKKIYKESSESIINNKKILGWEKKNQWIKSYASYSYLKEKNKELPWEEWKNSNDLTSEEIENFYEKNRKNMHFYSWIQYHLEKQLSSSASYMESIGVNLKGDLPILMNVDSADVWEFRDIFNTKNRAGAPPDMFSEDGQNWGFPTYNWDVMEKNNYKWWKDRLKQASKFYHAYRIDHVLGFFRIWTIPEKYQSGSMGYYKPNVFITPNELGKIGISGDRLKWMSEPHVPGYELRNRLGIESNDAIKSLLVQIGNEDLYLFRDEVKSVQYILDNQELSDDAKSTMINFYHNIALLKVDEDSYTTTWFYYNSRAFHSLSDHEKYLLSELLNSKNSESMFIWEAQGLKLLDFMKNSQDMLVCAEDLGTIPACVPKVLEELKILGLHITRWSRRYEEYGDPYIKPSEYNYLSVSTPAVHDSTTVRQWWSELTINNEVSRALNLDVPLEKNPSGEEIYRLYEALLKTSSKIAMFQFQDLLAIDEDLRRDDPESERINVPGTVTDENWSYRIDFTIEQLLRNKPFTLKIKNLTSKRG